MELEPLDVVVAAILGIAFLRGLFLGLVREAFSLGALAAAFVAVRLFRDPVAEWLVQATSGDLGETTAPWAAGALLAIGAIAAVAIAGRVVRRGVHAVGLGWADRAGGALLGAAEGALVAGILLAVGVALLGRGHPVIADSRSLAAYEELERIAGEPERPSRDVAAPPRSL